jgi:hypothetical protein
MDEFTTVEKDTTRQNGSAAHVLSWATGQERLGASGGSFIGTKAADFQDGDLTSVSTGHGIDINMIP